LQFTSNPCFNTLIYLSISRQPINHLDNNADPLDPRLGLPAQDQISSISAYLQNARCAIKK
jgi:hypothetical protein